MINYSDELITELIYKNNIINEIINVKESENPCGMIEYFDFSYDNQLTSKNGPCGELLYVDFSYNQSESPDQSIFGTPMSRSYIDNGNINEISLISKNKSFQIESFDTFIEKSHMINVGLDYDTEIISALINKSKSTILKNVLKKIDNIADKKYNNSFTRWDKILRYIYKIFKKNYVKAYNVKDDVRNIISKILYHSNYIHKLNRRGPANICIISSSLESVLSNYEQYVPNMLDSNFNTFYKCGSIGKIQFYVDLHLNYDDKSITLMKSTSEDEPGIHLRYMDSKITTVTEPYNRNEKSVIRNRVSVIDFDAEDFIDKFYIKNINI